MEMMTPIEWLLSGDTGISSKTILSVMTGSKMSGRYGPGVPLDSSDFGRCYRLLKIFPKWAERLNEVSERYPVWGPMIEAWGELTDIYTKLQTIDETDLELNKRIDALVRAGIKLCE
jgi:hypothetical protein